MTEHFNRSIIKDITWPLIATINTIFIAWIITGQTSSALEIGGTEIFIKIIFFYLHEQLWSKVGYGLEASSTNNTIARQRGERSRNIFKGITWRTLGVFSLVVIATIVTGSYQNAILIGLLTVSAKIILYYLHYSIWKKINLRVNARKSKNGRDYMIDETDQSFLFYN